MDAVDGLTYARAQMGLSLAFHIVFAAAGVALPVLMVLADLRHRRHARSRIPARSSKRLAKGTGILFAVGAVSGTVLSFELGLLWPRFMGTFGEVIGLPFALEGFAFFTEAIFLGIYLYGRERVSPRAAPRRPAWWWRLSGAASAFFVTLVNAFMNGPPASARGRADRTSIRSRRCSARRGRTRWCTCCSSCYQATAFAMVGHPRLHAAAPPGAHVPPQGAGDGAAGRVRHGARCSRSSGDRSAKHVGAARSR